MLTVQILWEVLSVPVKKAFVEMERHAKVNQYRD